MLSSSQVASILALPVQQRQARYLELANKIAALVILTKEEMEELILLRNSLRQDAGEPLAHRPDDSPA